MASYKGRSGKKWLVEWKDRWKDVCVYVQLKKLHKNDITEEP